MRPFNEKVVEFFMTIFVVMILVTFAGGVGFVSSHVLKPGQEDAVFLEPAEVYMATWSERPAEGKVTFRRASCSATHIGGGLFLTAAHCASTPNQPQYFFTGVEEPTPETEPAQMLWRSPEYDIALYYAPEAGEGRAERVLSCSGDLPEGAEVEHIGWPKGVRVHTYGRVAGVTGDEFNLWKRAQIINLSAAPGSSGGAVISTETGELVGMLNGGPAPFGAVAIMVPSSVICGLLGRGGQL